VKQCRSPLSVINWSFFFLLSYVTSLYAYMLGYALCITCAVSCEQPPSAHTTDVLTSSFLWDSCHGMRSSPVTVTFCPSPNDHTVWPLTWKPLRQSYATSEISWNFYRISVNDQWQAQCDPSRTLLLNCLAIGQGVNPAGDRGTRPQNVERGDGNTSSPLYGAYML